MASFVCPICGARFIAYNLRRRYCSRACSSQAKSDNFKAALRTKTCEACGKSFLVAGSRSSRLAAPPSQRLCSLECQQLARHRRAVTSLKTLTIAQSAYLAGFIDGEGSVILHGRESGSISLRVTMSNTHRPTLDRIQEMCGCGSVVQRVSTNSRHKDAGWWQINSESAATLLRQTLPYMVTKRVQAELALSFQERLRDPALKADRAWQLEYLARMQALNRRGPSRM